MLFRRFTLALTLMALAFALAACDSGLPGTPTPLPPSPSPTSPPEPTSAPTSAPTSVPSGDTSITLDKTGGIAGIHDTLAINAQGEATYTSRTITHTQTLPAATYAALLKQIDTADFFNLNDNYDNGNVSDDFYFTVTVTQGDRTKTVRMAGAGGEDLAPQPLKDLVAQLTDIQNTLSSTGTTITFITTGGIAGIADTLTITPDLRAVYSSRGFQDKHSLISADQYTALLAQIDKADFFNLKDNYQGAVPDAFIYTVTVTDPTRTKTVTTSQTSDYPQPLHELIAQLNDIQNTVDR